VAYVPISADGGSAWNTGFGIVASIALTATERSANNCPCLYF